MFEYCFEKSEWCNPKYNTRCCCVNLCLSVYGKANKSLVFHSLAERCKIHLYSRPTSQTSLSYNFHV